MLTTLMILATLALPVMQALPAQPHDVVSNLFAVGGALATSALLGASKKYDTSLTNSKVFRKLQPVITLAGAFAAPLIASHLGVQFDPTVFATAPASAIAAITAAELMAIGRRSIPSLRS